MQMSPRKQWTDAYLLATGLIVAFRIIPTPIRPSKLSITLHTTENPIDLTGEFVCRPIQRLSFLVWLG